MFILATSFSFIVLMIYIAMKTLITRYNYSPELFMSLVMIWYASLLTSFLCGHVVAGQTVKSEVKTKSINFS